MKIGLHIYSPDYYKVYNSQQICHICGSCENIICFFISIPHNYEQIFHKLN